MIDITVTSDNLIKATTSVDLSMNNFENISDVLEYVKLSKIFEEEVKLINASKKAIIDNLHANPDNKIIKDGVEHWTKDAYRTLQEELVKLMSETKTFSLPTIENTKLDTYPPTMGNFIKVFYEIFVEPEPKENVPAKGKKNGKN